MANTPNVNGNYYVPTTGANTVQNASCNIAPIDVFIEAETNKLAQKKAHDEKLSAENTNYFRDMAASIKSGSITDDTRKSLIGKLQSFLFHVFCADYVDKNIVNSITYNAKKELNVLTSTNENGVFHGIT